MDMQELPCGVKYRHWHAGEATRGVILLVHGLGEHSGRYEHVAAQLNARGFSVLAPDHLGHGESPGTRVYVDAFDDYLVAVRECRDLIEWEYPDLPCFVIGHSMGGLITARLLLEDQARYVGAVLSGPAFAATEPPSAVVMWIGRLLARLLPKTGMIELDASGVSRDPKVVAAYNADPLVNHGKITARLGIGIFDAMADVMARAETITLPLLIMHGGADTMAAPEGSQAFAAAVGSSDNSLNILPGLYHEIFNEPEGPDVIAAVIDWLEARLP